MMPLKDVLNYVSHSGCEKDNSIYICVLDSEAKNFILDPPVHVLDFRKLRVASKILVSMSVSIS